MIDVNLLPGGKRGVALFLALLHHEANPLDVLLVLALFVCVSLVRALEGEVQRSTPALVERNKEVGACVTERKIKVCFLHLFLGSCGEHRQWRENMSTRYGENSVGRTGWERLEGEERKQTEEREEGGRGGRIIGDRDGG